MAIHAASCQRILSTLAIRRTRDSQEPSLQVQLVTELWDLFDHETPEPVAPSRPAATDTHVPSYGGGSRDNPGPGGFGACVVRVDNLSRAATVIWSAAMNHAHTAPQPTIKRSIKACQVARGTSTQVAQP
jgi:hypothetical protein